MLVANYVNTFERCYSVLAVNLCINIILSTLGAWGKTIGECLPSPNPRAMMDYLKALDDVQEVYTRHLALLVCDCGENVLLLPLRIAQMHG